MVKASVKPSIRKMNISLRNFEEGGHWSARECIIQRAKFFKAMQRKPKR